MGQRYFKKEVLDEANAIAFSNRVWERPQVPGLTIDGAESRDLDDAIWLQEIPDGVILSVHIADVAEYVCQGSALDQDAMARTQTRYLKSGNDPMLPSVLSENRLSLLEGQARPTLSVNITLDSAAQIQNVDIFESWISTVKRFSYPEVDEALQDPQSKFNAFLNSCLQWADRLYQQRTDPEQLKQSDNGDEGWLDENGNWVIGEGTRYHAYLIIQEFMIVANTAIAQWMANRNLAALYRNHIPNDDSHDSPQALFETLIAAGWEGDLHRRLQCGLNRAEYANHPIGHFALKLSAYCHFTSPIRRLADLINHRIIKAHLQGLNPPYSPETLAEISAQIESVVREQEEATKTFFKAFHQEQYEALLKRAYKVARLDSDEFSLLLRYAAKSDQMDAIAPQVGKRLHSNYLTVEDWFVVLFLSSDTSLKQLVLDGLKREVHHAPSIIAIAQNQLEEWEEIDYVIQPTPSSFEARLVVSISGQYWTTQTTCHHSRKQGAKHYACAAWIDAHSHGQLVPSTESPQPLIAAADDHATAVSLLSLSTEINATSQLNECCQKFQWESPSYTFYEEETEGFMCECELKTPDRIILGFGSGQRKTLAKTNAAQHVLEQVKQHSDLTITIAKSQIKPRDFNP